MNKSTAQLLFSALSLVLAVICYNSRILEAGLVGTVAAQLALENWGVPREKLIGGNTKKEWTALGVVMLILILIFLVVTIYSTLFPQPY